MAYLLHPNANTPEDDVVIWRYMDLPQFLVLLEQRSIYFALKDKLLDKWEFAIPRQMELSIASHFGPTMSGDFISLSQALTEGIGVSCWHENMSESIAMWSLYTHDGSGIAIQTSIGNLKMSLRDSPQDIHIGRVRYEDHDFDSSQILPRSEVTPIRNVLQKRRCFEHENEVRAFFHIHPEFPEQPLPGQTMILPYPEHGVSLQVDLKPLIGKVVLSPSFPTWAKPVIEGALHRCSLTPQIEVSRVQSVPGSQPK
jgi:hypothetical protein